MENNDKTPAAESKVFPNDSAMKVGPLMKPPYTRLRGNNSQKSAFSSTRKKESSLSKVASNRLSLTDPPFNLILTEKKVKVSFVNSTKTLLFKLFTLYLAQISKKLCNLDIEMSTAKNVV